MPIRVDCLACKKWYRAPEKAAGKVVKCPGCGGELKVPLDAPAITEAPKASGAPRPASAKPAARPVPVPVPVPVPESPSFEDDDPFGIPGFPSLPSAPSANGSGTTAPVHAPPPRRQTARSSSGGVAPACMELIDWVACHPLVVAVSALALTLLIVGVATGGRMFVVGAAGAAAGGVIAALGLIFPDRPQPKKRPASKQPTLATPTLVGGIGIALLAIGWEVGSALLRHSAQLEQSGQAVTPGAMAGATGRVMGGVVAVMIVCMGISGTLLAIVRFGVFRVFAPIYLVAGFGTLMALAVGPTAPGRVDLPPAGAIVAGESGPVAIADPLAPQSAAIGRAVLGGSRAVGDVIRSEYTLPTGAGGGGTPLKFVVYRKVFVNWSQEVAAWPCVILTPAGSNLLSGRDLGDGDHPEALPWANAGYVVIQVALPGAIADPERVTGGEVKRTFAEFSLARAGLGCVEQVLASISQEMPQVDPRRIAAVGHSSAGTLALLAAESNPEIKACVAFAPCTDVTEFHRDNFAVLEPVIPTVRKFCSDYSPINHVDRLQCPTFFFQADDDSVTPVAGAIRFVDAAKEKGKLIEFVRVPTGDHYESMISQGIPTAIEWLDATFARVIAPRPAADP